MILIGIVCYLIAANIVVLTHEHDHDVFGSEYCSACFFNTNHLGIEPHAVDLTNLDACISIPNPINFTFISTILASSVHSRAPPVFSV